MPPSERPESEPLKVRAGRIGELDHSELVHLLDSLDDDRSRSRFRESIYLSVIVYLALAWFVLYGPKVLFHQGRIVSPADVLKQRDKEITFLETPKDLSKLAPKDTKVVSDPHGAPADPASDARQKDFGGATEDAPRGHSWPAHAGPSAAHAAAPAAGSATAATGPATAATAAAQAAARDDRQQQHSRCAPAAGAS